MLEFEEFLNKPVKTMTEVIGKKGFMATDCYQKDGRLIYEIDVPSVKKEDISVDLSDNCLIVEIHSESENKVQKETIVLQERERSTMRRLFKLPTLVKAEDIKAALKDGVLTITVDVPKDFCKSKITIE